MKKKDKKKKATVAAPTRPRPRKIAALAVSGANTAIFTMNDGSKIFVSVHTMERG